MIGQEGTLKTCAKCKQTKPMDDFNNDATQVSGKRSRCRECLTSAEAKNARKETAIANMSPERKAMARARSAAWRANHKTLAVQRSKESRAKKLEFYQAAETARTARGRLRRHGQPVTECDVIFVAQVYKRDGGVCGICQTPVSLGECELDHIVPLRRGGDHIETNVQVAHGLCNRRKGDKVAEVRPS